MDGMPNVGTEVVIVEDGRVLLVKRADFEVWGLPGGYVESGESLTECAVREAREETGLQVRLSGLVGVYSFRHWLKRGYHFAAFLAKPIGGSLHPQLEEVMAVEYFEPAGLPETLGFAVEQVVADALTEQSGFVRSHDGKLDQEFTVLLQGAAASGLSRSDFYLSAIAPELQPDSMSSDLDVEGP